MNLRNIPRKYFRLPVALLGAAIILAGGEYAQRLSTSEKIDSISNQSDNVISSDDAAEFGDSVEIQAASLIDKAFSFDVAKYAPIVDQKDNLTTIRYTVEPEEYYIVELQEELEFPAMIYHFCHLGEDPEFDLGKESSDFFKDEMLTVAKNYVQDVYEIDCSDVDIHAYGYKNKIAVQIEVSSEMVFQVRFYYEDIEPVGILFYDNADVFEQAMSSHGAIQYF